MKTAHRVLYRIPLTPTGHSRMYTRKLNQQLKLNTLSIHGSHSIYTKNSNAKFLVHKVTKVLRLVIVHTILQKWILQ